MDMRIYLESTIKSPRESQGTIAYVIETKVNGKPVTVQAFESIVATKNQAQIIALNMALARLKRNAFTLSIYADFEQFEQAFSQGWLTKWREQRWKNAKGEHLKNASLWQETLILLNGNEVLFEKTSQHEYSKWIKTEIERLEDENV